jgi:hypothetical protein
MQLTQVLFLCARAEETLNRCPGHRCLRLLRVLHVRLATDTHGLRLCAFSLRAGTLATLFVLVEVVLELKKCHRVRVFCCGADDSRAPCVCEGQLSILVDLPPLVVHAPLLHAHGGGENHPTLVREGTAQLICSMGTVVHAFAVLGQKGVETLALDHDSTVVWAHSAGDAVTS